MSVHHYWGDEDFDWDGLNSSINIITDICRFWRLGIHSKEKYGTARITPWFWDGSLHSLIWPGYVYRQYPKNWIGDKLWWLDIYFFPRFFNALFLTRLVFWFHAKIYNYAFQKAIKKYPHLKEELLVDADGCELIDGGKEVHDKYWVQL